MELNIESSIIPTPSTSITMTTRNWRRNPPLIRHLFLATLLLMSISTVAANRPYRSLATSLPYRLPKLFEVGGPGVHWTVPASATFFERWAASITLRPGDCLQFSQPLSGFVDTVPAASYANCSSDGYYKYWSTARMSELILQMEEDGIGVYYFIQDDVTSCSRGLKFVISVASVVVPGPPVQAQNTTKLQGRVAREFQVGGTGQAWKVPSTIDYFSTWANNITFRVGDTLRFNMNSTDFEVSLVPYKSFEMCFHTGYTWFSKYSTEPFTFEQTGVYYFVASKPQYCLKGMRFAASVYNANGTLVNVGRSSGSDSGSDSKFEPIMILYIIIAVLGAGVGFYLMAKFREFFGCHKTEHRVESE